MKIIITLVTLHFITGYATAQDTCKVFGQKNPHGLAMQVRGPMYVMDSVNFKVTSTKPLPYNIGATDTIYFEVCILARDGKQHSTQVRYGSTHGAVSFNVTMTAPTISDVVVSENSGVFLELHALGDYLDVITRGDIGYQPVLVIYSVMGQEVMNLPLVAEKQSIRHTLRSGWYRAVLRANGKDHLYKTSFYVVR